MTQRRLPYEYEIEEGKTGLTEMGGLPTYLDLARATGLLKAIEKNLKICTGVQGWTDVQMVMSLVLLNLAGGDSVGDIDRLEGDEGFSQILRKVEEQELTRKERRELRRRWRKGRTRTLPSASALFRYLANFHDAEEENHRQEGKAFIPKANDHLKALGRINKELTGFENNGEETATLDMDATLSTTWKNQALYSYKGDKAYQPRDGS